MTVAPATAAGRWRATSIGTGHHDFYTALGRGGVRRTGGSIRVTGSGDIAPAVADAGPDTASDSLLFGVVVALIALIVVGAMFATSEYRRGLIRTTLAATPRRGRVLAAKAGVIGGRRVRRRGGRVGRGDPARTARDARRRELRLPGRCADDRAGDRRQRALIALSAVAVLGIATILRRSPGAILAGVVLFVLPAFTGPGVLGSTSGGSAATWLYTVTPAAGFSVIGLMPRSPLVSYPYTMANGYYPLPAWAGLLVLCAWAAAALVAARIVLRRRDA